MELQERARIHAALGDEARLVIVDALAVGDLSVSELQGLVDMPGNLLAHHLGVLEAAGVVERRRSEGDRRRRYVVLRRIDGLLPKRPAWEGTPLFVCTHNSARSQFAAGVFRSRTGRKAQSAGTRPAERVHPTAVAVAAELGIDLSDAVPRGYSDISGTPDVVISVCDRAQEAEFPMVAPRIHWSVPDPVLRGSTEAFRAAFAEIEQRVSGLLTSSPDSP